MTNYNKKIKNKKVDHVTADRRSIYHQHHQGHPHHSASPLHVIITVIIIPLDSLQKHSSCHHRGWVNTYAYTSLEIIGPLLADEHPTIWCRARGSGTLNAHPTLVSVFPRTRASSAGTSWDHVHSPPVTKGSLRDWTADPFPINPPMGWKLLKNWHHLLYIVFFFFLHCKNHYSNLFNYFGPVYSTPSQGRAERQLDTLSASRKRDRTCPVLRCDRGALVTSIRWTVWPDKSDTNMIKVW